jgi:hypothetical protein
MSYLIYLPENVNGSIYKINFKTPLCGIYLVSMKIFNKLNKDFLNHNLLEIFFFTGTSHVLKRVFLIVQSANQPSQGTLNLLRKTRSLNDFLFKNCLLHFYVLRSSASKNRVHE